MNKLETVRKFEEIASEFEQLEWLGEVVLFGEAIDEEPLDSDVDVLFITNRALSAREMSEATAKLKPLLERRLGQPLLLRITTRHSVESMRGQHVGSGRHLKGRHVSVFRRSPPSQPVE